MLQGYVGARLCSLFAQKGRWIKRPPVGLDDFQKAGPHTVVEIACKGKLMYWRFTTEWTMLVTYGMSGQLVTEPTKHSHAELSLVRPSDDTRHQLYFDDPRRFGTLKFIHGSAAFAKKLATLGPDMLNDPPTVNQFAARLNKKKTSRTLAEALMDQSVVSGIGNYVKAEALYRAKLSPWRKVCDLTIEEILLLHSAIIKVMMSSYGSGGATIATYRNPDGSIGQAQRRFAVYGHKQDPFGNVVTNEETPDKRTSWWCHAVQK